MPAFGKFFSTLDVNYLFVDQAAIDTAEQVQRDQTKILDRQFKQDKISQDRFNELSRDMNYDQTYAGAFSDPDQSPLGGFQEGLGDGLNNLTSASRGFLNGLAGTIFKSLPIWLWLLIVVGLAFYFVPGLPKRIQKALA